MRHHVRGPPGGRRQRAGDVEVRAAIAVHLRAVHAEQIPAARTHELDEPVVAEAEPLHRLAVPCQLGHTLRADAVVGRRP
jgi:hypothetical protein